ncbi:hypothetical protein NXH64_04825 [Butyrivibrio fibrisolvens]|uniref:hypothetical protein n=1 Tax=Pseudobutyrivibrio ruminis TaxID=46206 RepID=UPI0004034E5D|nr:hypothetical protein [Pseudobutyrivibrio ruminis]MDC7278823.1 hypothetical protein [Butyrivibrio fibrisolvens]
MDNKGLIKKLFKEKNFIAISLVMMVLLFSLPAFRSGVYLGHDLVFHLGRIQVIAAELRSGQFPVRYEHDAWFGYGYISSTMYPNIFMYFPAVLNILGVPLFRAYNIYVIAVNIATVGISYFSFKRIFKENKWGLLGTLIYSFAAYRFSNVYQRAAVGEYTAMAFIPLLVYGFYKLYFEEKEEPIFKRIAPIVIAAFGVLQTHMLTTEMLAIFVFIFALVYIKRTLKVFKELMLSVVVILLTNAFYLVPFLQIYLTEHLNINTSITKFGVDGEGLYISQFFKPFSQGRGADLSWSPNHEEFLALGIGLVICVVAMIALIVFSKKLIVGENGKKHFKAALLIFGLGLLAAYVSSIYFPWKAFEGGSFVDKLLSSIQFPWRYLSIMNICFTVVGVYAIKTFSQKKNLYKISFVLFGVIAFLQAGIFFRYLSYSNETFAGNHMDGWPGEADSLYLIDGTDKKIIEEEGDNVEIVFDANTVTLPKFGYKNMVVTDDQTGEEIQWQLGDNNRIVIASEDYSEDITVDYKIPWIWHLSELVSLISVVGYLVVARGK